jgi:hypothetical protein
VEAVLVLGTHQAPARSRRRARRARETAVAEPVPAPIARATVVRATAFDSAEDARAWLAELRGDEQRLEAELSAALVVLNRALRAGRVAAADPYLAEVSAERALVARVGYGRGDAVADGRFAEAVELPAAGARKAKRSMEAPEERFAALLGAREQALVAEDLVLRARADLNGAGPRAAALQARVALEALIAELAQPGELASHREAVAGAANAALRGDLGAAELSALTEAITAMEAALRRHRLGA